MYSVVYSVVYSVTFTNFVVTEIIGPYNKAPFQTDYREAAESRMGDVKAGQVL